MSLLLALTITGGSVPVSGSDSGVGTEGTGTIAATLTFSDTGSGAEGQSLSVTLSSSDVGVAVDNGLVTFKIFFDSESGFGADAVEGLTTLLARRSRLQAGSIETAVERAASGV